MRKESKYAIMNGKEKRHFKTINYKEQAYIQASQVFSDEFIGFLDVVSQEGIIAKRKMILDKLDLCKDGIDTKEFMQIVGGLAQVAIEFYLTLKKQKGVKAN